MSSRRVIVLEGPVGVGKSSVMRELGRMQMENVVLVEEPIKGLIRENFLLRYLDNPKEYGFAFQLHAMHSLTEKWLQALDKAQVNDDTIFVCDRHLISSTDLFAQMMLEEHILEKWQVDLLRANRDDIGKAIPILHEDAIDTIIFLVAKPENVLARVQSRERCAQEIENAKDFARGDKFQVDMQKFLACFGTSRETIETDYVSPREVAEKVVSVIKTNLGK